MHQRVRQPLDHGLVQLRGFAFRHQRDLLAGLGREIVDQPPEPAKKLRHRNHPYRHHAVAQFGGQMLDLFGHRPQIQIRTRRRDLLQPRLRDHQLAHPVHQLIQPQSRHAHGGIGAHRLGIRRLRRRGLGDRRHFHVRRRVFDQLDSQRHIVAHEQKHVLDRRARFVRRQLHIPAQITRRRVQRAQRRNVIAHRRDPARPQFAQFIQHRQRARAVHKNIRRQAEIHPVAHRAGRRRRRARRDFGHRTRSRPAHRRVQCR